MKKKSRPNEVSIALALLWTLFAIYIIKIIPILTEPGSIFDFISGVGFAIIISLILIFFIEMIRRGENWARITLLVLAIISIINTAFTYANPLEIIEIVLLVIASILLFQKSSSKWFMSKKK